MLEEIKIQNYQCHEKLRIQFDPHITSIIGPSDSGKSAILRALRYALTNQPSGDSHIRTGSKGCTVSVVVDGRTVTRRRGGSDVNEYKLDDSSFVAFGSDVPEPIKQLVNLSGINFQLQMDSPFWFCETAGQVSRNLNAIVDLSLVDDSLSRINSTLTKCKAEVDVATRRMKEAQEGEEKLRWIKDAEEEWNSIRVIEEDTLKISNQRMALHQLLSETKSVEETHKKASLFVRLSSSALALGEEALDAGDEASYLEQLLREITYLNSKILAIPDLSKLEEAFNKIRQAQKVQSQLEDIVEDIYALERQETSLQAIAQDAEEDLYQQSGGVCPLCQQKIEKSLLVSHETK